MMRCASASPWSCCLLAVDPNSCPSVRLHSRELGNLCRAGNNLTRTIIDVHLLASPLVSGINLWTADKRLHEIACTLGCGHE